MVLAYNQQTGDYATKDYGPAHGNGGNTGNRLIEVAGGKVSAVDDYLLRGITSADDLRQSYSAVTIQTTPEVAQQVIDAIRSSYGDEPKEFNALYGPNCSSSCATVLHQIADGEKTPAGLWTDLMKKYAKDSQNRRGFGYLTGTTSPHQPGTEYGNARYGMNTFDFLYLLLHPQKACVTAHDSASGQTFGGCDQ